MSISHYIDDFSLSNEFHEFLTRNSGAQGALHCARIITYCPVKTKIGRRAPTFSVAE
jgi:hypothetical protein